MIGAMSWLLGTPARADDYRLAADTKIQVAIVQWNPAKGEYQRWDALGGVFQVTADGTIALPVVGSLHVSDKTSIEAAAEISAALRGKMGLLSPPDVTVEIAQYPAIYVVGAVTTPGAYPFRPGLTVLQALAIAGGRYRPPLDLRGGQNAISINGELASVAADSLRLIGRIARLQAELAGDTDISFPQELTTSQNSKLVSEIMALERTLFVTRANETKRQLTTLADLRGMYTGEIQLLDAKSKDSNNEISQTEEEVAGLTKLVEKGITTVSRWSELRRVLAQMRAAHSEDDIETMRARQNLSDTMRQEFGIRDKRQTEVATQLRDSQADLARLKSRENTLRQLVSGDNAGNLAAPAGGPDLVFTVVRQGQPDAVDVPASESMLLRPGDVLKVATMLQNEAAPGIPSPMSTAPAGVVPDDLTSSTTSGANPDAALSSTNSDPAPDEATR
jgi:polysaccharide export outer membrane protein